MVQLRDFFTQSGEEASELEREEPRVEQLGEENPPVETSSELPLFSEKRSKPGGYSFDADFLETCNVPILDAVNDTSSAHDSTSNSKPENSGVATLPGAEGAADVRVKPLHPDDAPVGCQDSNKSVSKAEDNTQVTSCESIGNIEAEPADSIISAVGSESLVSMANSFTFGTVLRKQVFGRAGSESQSECDRGNPVQTTQNTADLIQSCPRSNKREISGTVPTNTRGNKDKVLGNLITTQESKQECSHSSLNSSPTREERSSINERENDIVDREKTLQGLEILLDQTTNTSVAAETGLGDTAEPLHSGNTLNTDLSNPQTTTERLHLQGEAQEHNVTLDPKSTAERAQVPLAEHACAQTTLSETHVQSGKEVMTSQEISSESLQTPQIVSECVSDEANQQTSSRGSNGSKCVTQESHEESHNMEEKNQEGVMNYFMHGDTSYPVKCEQTEHHEIRAADSGCLVDTASCWEMVVQEEETNILTEEEECKAISSKIEEAEVVEKDQGEQMDDAEIETASENIETTEMEKGKTDVETVDRITAARQKENKAKDSSQETTWEAKEQATRTTREVESAAEIMKKEKTVLEKEKHSAETSEVNIETVNVPEEKEIDINLINSDEAIGDIVKVRDDNVEEGNPDYMEEILVDGTSQVVDAELEDMTTGGSGNEAGCLEERLDITEAKDRNDSSAPVIEAQDERKPDKENTGEVQSATIADEGQLHKGEAFSNIANDTRDQSKPKRGETSASETHSCILADEPESHDSTSTESDSDDEVELYMHCLRAVHGGAQAHKDKSRDAFSGAAFPVSRSKLMSEPMPSITESVDEEQPPVHCHGDHEDTETADIQTIDAALPLSPKQGNIDTNVSWWEESFSCSNITKMLFYASMFILFVVVASYYDFLACFGLYIISLIWLCCHGERPSVKNNRLD